MKHIKVFENFEIPDYNVIGCFDETEMAIEEMNNQIEIVNESDAKIAMLKNIEMPSNANEANSLMKKYLPKLEKVKVRVSYTKTALLYKDLKNLNVSGKISRSSLLNEQTLGYAYGIKGKDNVLIGYKDWGILNKDFALVYVPDGNWKSTALTEKKFVGWNYVWVSEIAVV
jgi:hypothetical protein